MISHHQNTIENTFAGLKVSPDGLSPEQAARRLAEYGPNELRAKKKKTMLTMFVDQFTDFMILVLIGAAVISGFIGDAADTIAIIVIVVLNANIGFTQEYRAEQAMAALQKMAAPSALVRRMGGAAEIPAREIVPGDVIDLESGKIVPADLRLVGTAKLRMEEAPLTGESVPVEKLTAPLPEEVLSLGDRRNMAYKSTTVTYGRGVGIAVARAWKRISGKSRRSFCSPRSSLRPWSWKISGRGREKDRRRPAHDFAHPSQVGFAYQFASIESSLISVDPVGSLIPEVAGTLPMRRRSRWLGNHFMRIDLQVQHLRFRPGEGHLSLGWQRDILSKRIAGSKRVVREGEALKELERLLALRADGPAPAVLLHLPVHPMEPYRIKSVELRGQGCPPEGCPPYDRRLQAIEEAGYNTFLLKEDKGIAILIDLLTDSGTTAMSDCQWSAMLRANEDYAGSRSYYALEKTIQEVYGWKEVVPTHQGRGAEHIVSTIFIKPLLEQYPGDPVYVPKNMYFTTTKVHILRAGGVFLDIIIDEAHNPAAWHPFKGNIDLGKFQRLIDDCIARWGAVHGPRHIAYVHLEGCVNMAGGQPFSMENLRELRAMTSRYGIPLLSDATRLVENAYFIQQREAGYREKSVAEIVREIGSLTDGCTMSSKKDNLVNIGGFLALNDREKAAMAREMLVDFEGFPTYGGMAGYSMEALAQGIRECIDDNWIAYRVGQTQYLGQRLINAGVPVVTPMGGHAVFIDAKAFLPHLSREQFPAQALASAIYLHSGVRTMERGIVSAGRDGKTGKQNSPALELVRLTIPRRVYTQSHMDYVADKIGELHRMRERISGLAVAWEPPAGSLRFFLMRFTPSAAKLIG